MKSNHTPEIRFPGFTGNWEQRKLGDLLIDVSRPLKMIDDDYYQLVTVKRRNGGIVSRGIYKGSEVLVKSQFLIKTGDYLISKRQVVHGANGIVPEYLNGSIVSNEYLVLHGNKDLNIEFFSLISELPIMYKNYFLSSYGIDIEKLVFNVHDWKKRRISIPSIPEQNQITSFINNLNNAITLQQQELTILKQTKQGFLQKMFPREGESVPEVRFPGFKEDWERRKLGEVSPLRGGYAFQSSSFKQNGVPIIRISNILSNEEVGGEYAYYEEQLDDSKYTLPDGAALLAMSGATTGKVSILKNSENKKMYQNQRVGYFSDLNIIDYTFISTITRSQLFTNQLKSVLVAGAQPNISSKEVDNFEFYFPTNKEEQIKIGIFFNKIDETIALHQRELDALKETKKAFLQKMFV